MEFPVDIGRTKVTIGDDLVIELDFVTEADVPVDLNYLSNWRAQTRPGSQSSQSLSFMVDSTDSGLGKIVISLTGVQTAKMDPNSTWGWDLECHTSDNRVLTIASGMLMMKPDWTR